MAKWTGTVEALVHDYLTSDATLDAWWEMENSSKKKRARHNAQNMDNKRPKTFKEMAKEVSEDARKAVERGEFDFNSRPYMQWANISLAAIPPEQRNEESPNSIQIPRTMSIWHDADGQSLFQGKLGKHETAPFCFQTGRLDTELLQWLQQDPELPSSERELKEKYGWTGGSVKAKSLSNETKVQVMAAARPSKRSRQLNGLKSNTPLPARLMAFTQAWIAVNKDSLDDLQRRIHLELDSFAEHDLKTNGEHLKRTPVSEWIFQHGMIQVMRPTIAGEKRMDPKHTDGGASLVHMGMSLFGERNLLFWEKGNDTPGQIHNGPGAVYISNPGAFEHQVLHEDHPCDEQKMLTFDGCPCKVAIQLRCEVFKANRGTKPPAKPMNVFKAASAAVAAWLCSRQINLPTLEQCRACLGPTVEDPSTSEMLSDVVSTPAKARTLASKVRLNNGVLMPVVGFGTYKIPKADLRTVFTSALATGYCLVDTAQAYDNEAHVGKACKDLPRDRIFITTKIKRTQHGYENARRSVEESLKKLGVTQIDLVLIHWPGHKDWGTQLPADFTPEMRNDTWRALEDLYDEQKIRAIGVANYGIRHLESLLEVCRIKPAVNQIEFHPWLIQTCLLEYCKQNDIAVQVYGSLGTGDGGMTHQFFRMPPVAFAAEKFSVTPAQVLLKWALQKGCHVIPKSSREERQKENAQVFHFELADEDISAIDNMHQNRRLAWKGKDPDAVA